MNAVSCLRDRRRPPLRESPGSRGRPAARLTRRRSPITLHRKDSGADRMPPRDALAQIAEIRQQLAIAGTYRGFRSAAVATTGLLAITAAILQPIFVTNPMQQ